MQKCICLNYVFSVLSETVHDVARKQVTWQSSTVPGGDSNYAVDGDKSTCMRTVEENGAIFGIDLGAKRTITGVELDGGKSRISYSTLK